MSKNGSKDLPAVQPSPLRNLLSETGTVPVVTLHRLEEAKKYFDAYVIFEGDDGGQIYLSCPAAMVHCSEDALKELLLTIDKAQWNDPTMARICYERMETGGISGGMGGGFAAKSLWLHPNIEHLCAMIEAILFKI